MNILKQVCVFINRNWNIHSITRAFIWLRLKHQLFRKSNFAISKITFDYQKRFWNPNIRIWSVFKNQKKILETSCKNEKKLFKPDDNLKIWIIFWTLKMILREKSLKFKNIFEIKNFVLSLKSFNDH